MDIKYAILGFLSWRPFTGYELKKMVSESTGFHWSGNNNQIYTTLVQLHRDKMVTGEVQHQERYPTRKVYSITDAGLDDLKKWLLSAPELPQFKKSFLIKLAWADQLDGVELNGILEKYEYELQMQLLMMREQSRRGAWINPARTPREKYIWGMIAKNYIQSYEAELAWLRQLKRDVISKQ
jgi:PadR family transcriptional regulator, regulatory protein AphA